MECVRWAFNFRHWSPKKEDWKRCLSLVQPEEKERIAKFVFKKDAKASMVGRLMIRKLVSETLNIPWAEVKLGRTDRGRPFLINEYKNLSSHLDFNVSHQGEWVVLAAETDGSKVGIDVMRTDCDSTKNISEFFRLMNRQFSVDEWKNINSYTSPQLKLKAFYRHWCLKEAFVKALGIGITYNLQNISFSPSEEVTIDHVTKSTSIKVQEDIASDFIFEERLLDESHICATAIQGSGSENCSNFVVLTYNDLLTNSQVLTEPDDLLAELFMSKDESPLGAIFSN